GGMTVWSSPMWESTPRPTPYHGVALPTELKGRSLARGSTRKPAEKHSAPRLASTTGFGRFGTTIALREQRPDGHGDAAAGVARRRRADPPDLQLRGVGTDRGARPRRQGLYR